MPFISEFYPYQMIERYAALTVKADFRSVQVFVDRYRCVKKFTFASQGCDDALEVKDGLMAATKNKILSEAGGAQAFVDMFTGKASPENFETGLAAIWRNRTAFIAYAAKTGANKPNCAMAASVLGFTEPFAGIQAFVSLYLGMDCNGFVGRYMKRFSPPQGLSHVHTPGQWFDALSSASRPFRRKIEDIEVGDVVINTNRQHIGLIDIPSSSGLFDIAQSGGRMFFSSHRISATGVAKSNRPTFQIDKPQGGFGDGEVWIAKAASTPAHSGQTALGT